MIVVEYNEIELDYCPKCSGIWFDAGELELLLESLELKREGFKMEGIVALPERKVAEKPRRCPLCRKKMKKVIIGSDPEVLIDCCVRGEGLWFDGGELGQIVRQLPSAKPGTSGRIISFLGEVFQTKE
jgi:hypothetical protein